MFVAVNTTENSIVAGCGVAFGTTGPNTAMVPAINRKMLGVVVEGSGFPGILAVAVFAARRKLSRNMVGVFGLVVISYMAAHTGIRGVIVVSSDMALRAFFFNFLMGAFEGIELIVVKGSGYPGSGGMAGSTIGAELRLCMVR